MYQIAIAIVFLVAIPVLINRKIRQKALRSANGYIGISDCKFTDYFGAVKGETAKIISGLKPALALRHAYINASSGRRINGCEDDNAEIAVREGLVKIARIFGVRIVCDQIGSGVSTEEIITVLDATKKLIEEIRLKKTHYIKQGGFDGSEASFGTLNTYDDDIHRVIEVAMKKIMRPIAG